MGLPAARITDLHICPMFTGPVPHVGGPVLMPSTPTVLIGYLPAAGLGSTCVCVGPPDIIIRGAFNVLIGGRPAARITDNTVHGGMITLGCFTVLIGMAGSASSGSPGSATPSGGVGRPVSGVPCPSCLRKAKEAAKALVGTAGELAQAAGRAVADGIKTINDWGSHHGELLKWGSDAANVKLGSWGTDAHVGMSRKVGEEGFDLLKLGAHAEAVSAQAKGKILNGLADGEVSAAALAAKAEAAAGSSWNKNAKDLHAKAGVEVALVKAEAKGGVNIPIPFTKGWTLRLGGSAEGRVGAAAEAKGWVGWNKDKGYGFGLKAKVALGLGGGLGFSIGIKPPPKKKQ